MLSSLHRLSTEDLRQLADALRSGWVTPPFSSFLLRNFVPDALAGSVASDLQAAIEAGVSPGQLAEVVQLLVSDRGNRASAEALIDLVWTGPDVPGIVNRDTGVVVREMFRSARQSVLLAGYAVYQGQVIFKALAERMDQNPTAPGPDVPGCPAAMERLISPRRTGTPVRRAFHGQEWPGHDCRKLFYDPRSLETDSPQRASLHAKCIVVDHEQAFVIVGQLHDGGSAEEHRSRGAHPLQVIRRETELPLSIPGGRGVAGADTDGIADLDAQASRPVL